MLWCISYTILFHNTWRQGYLGLQSSPTPSEIFHLQDNYGENKDQFISWGQWNEKDIKERIPPLDIQNSIKKNDKNNDIPSFSSILIQNLLKSINLCSLLTEDQCLKAAGLRLRLRATHLCCPGNMTPAIGACCLPRTQALPINPRSDVGDSQELKQRQSSETINAQQHVGAKKTPNKTPGFLQKPPSGGSWEKSCS